MSGCQENFLPLNNTTLPNLDQFIQNIETSSSDEARNQAVTWNLGLPENHEVASLVQYLREESKVAQPEVPQHPISVHQKADSIIVHPFSRPLTDERISRDPIPIPPELKCVIFCSGSTHMEISESSNFIVSRVTSSFCESPNISSSASEPAKIDIMMNYDSVENNRMANNLHEMFITLIKEVVDYIDKNNIDIQKYILPFLINPPLSFKKSQKFKRLFKKRRRLCNCKNGTELLLFLSEFWDELHPNILFNLINGLSSNYLSEKGLCYQKSLMHCCKPQETRESYYHPEIGSLCICKKRFLVIVSDGDIQPPGIMVARRQESNVGIMEISSEYEHLKEVPQINGFSQSVNLEVCIICHKLSCSQFVESTSVKSDIKGAEKPKKYYLDEIEKFIEGCSYHGAYIWYIGHSEKATGNWCFKDGTISFEEILDIYRRKQQNTLLTIISDCSYSGNFVHRYTEILDSERIPPCGHKTSDAIRIYSSAKQDQEAQELCYADKGVEVRADGDLLFLDATLNPKQSTCYGDFTKLVCCGRPMDICRMDEDMKDWTWKDLVEGKFRDNIQIIRGYQRGKECWYVILLLKDEELTKYEAEIKKGDVDPYQLNCIILYSAIDERLPKKLLYTVAQRAFV